MPTLNKILNLLNEQNKTQKQLMEYLGLGKTAFTGWKSGKNTSYKKHIDKIADFFGVSIDYLLGRTNNHNDSDDNFADLFKNNGTSDNGILNLYDNPVLPGPYQTQKEENPSAETDKGEKLKNLTPEECEILKLFDSAPPQLRQAALAVLRAAEHTNVAPDADGTKK